MPEADWLWAGFNPPTQHWLSFYLIQKDNNFFPKTLSLVFNFLSLDQNNLFSAFNGDLDLDQIPLGQIKSQLLSSCHLR